MINIEGQMDLLDLLPKPPAPQRPTGPFICKWCGAEEPNEFLLQNNHWSNSIRSEMDQECIAMNLTRNHVAYWCAVMKCDIQPDKCCWTGKHKKPTFQTILEHLRADVRRAREVWPGDLPWLEPMVEAAGIPVEEVAA